MHSDAGILTIIMVKMQIFSNYIYIFRIMHTVQTSLCCIVFSYTLIWPISFRITSMALGQSYDCPSASEVILKDMGKCITRIHKPALRIECRGDHLWRTVDRSLPCLTGALLRAWLRHGAFWGCAPAPLTKLDLIDWLIDDITKTKH